jgi:ABC-type Fe3+/spermidine/putrescine transport system ATPase subunit
MTMIVLEQVSLALGEFNLHDVDLQIGKGEYLVLLGPSGAGKTVLLEIIAGLREADSGVVTINQRDMSGVLPEHRGTALVYQDYSLFPHMTSAENIAYGLKIQKRPVKEITERVDSLLADFGISSLKNRYPGSLSGGEQQRVAIARALATDPAVLLLDEPFASLDPRNRDECIRVMQELKETRAVTILQVSHSGDEAYTLADKVVVLLDGSVSQTGTPDEIFCHPASAEVAQFTGMENVMTGTVLSSDSGRSWVSIGSAVILLRAAVKEGTQISIGIPAGCIRVLSEKPVLDGQGTNCIPCQVRRVTWGKETAKLILEGAVPLTAVIQRPTNHDPSSLQNLNVYAVFKDTDVCMLSGARSINSAMILSDEKKRVHS